MFPKLNDENKAPPLPPHYVCHPIGIFQVYEENVMYNQEWEQLIETNK